MDASWAQGLSDQLRPRPAGRCSPLPAVKWRTVKRSRGQDGAGTSLNTGPTPGDSGPASEKSLAWRGGGTAPSPAWVSGLWRAPRPPARELFLPLPGCIRHPRPRLCLGWTPPGHTRRGGTPPGTAHGGRGAPSPGEGDTQMPVTMENLAQSPPERNFLGSSGSWLGSGILGTSPMAGTPQS